MKSYFTPKCVQRVIGLSYRQLQYWDKTKFISPSYRRRGKYRLYTLSDLVRMKVAWVLNSHHVSIQRLRTIIKTLPALMARINTPLTQATFMIDTATGRVWIFTGEVITNSDSAEGFVSVSMPLMASQINEYWPENDFAPAYEGASSNAAA